MKKLLFVIIIFILCFVLISGTNIPVFAGSTDTQTLDVQIDAINEISISGNPGSLTVNAASAGSQPTATTDATTNYAVTTNGTNKKITGVISAGGNLPSNITLSVTLAAPTGASSAGKTALSITAANLVTGISLLAESAKTINYELAPLAVGGTLTSSSKTITLTLTDG